MAKLNEIFGDFRSLWPKEAIKEVPGIEVTTPNPDGWLNALNLGLELKDLRIGSDGTKSSFEAKAELDNAVSGYSDGFPFVLTAMPDVEFRIPSQDKIKLYVGISAAGAEVLIENMEVEIRLPIGFVEPPQDDSSPPVFEEIKEGAGVKVIYRVGNPTSVFTKIRLHCNEDLQTTITTPAPISFEKCTMFDLPMKAVHDFRLLPSPELAKQSLDWVRHSVEPWIENYLVNGAFAVRSFHFDETKAPFKDLAESMNERSTRVPMAEFVLDDLVVPWYQVYVLPIPVHITVGIRKLFLTADQVASPASYFAFENAPFIHNFNEDPELALILNSFFFKSQPIDSLDENLGLSFEGGIVIKTSEQESSDPANPASDTNLKGHVIKLGLGEQYLIYAGYQFPEALKVLDIGGIAVQFVGFKLGYSIGRHLEAMEKGKGGGAAFGDSFLATVDLMITSQDEGDTDRLLNVRSLNGNEVKVILEGLGWKLGKFSFGESLKVPDGVAIWIKDVVALVFEEMGIVSESGAAYFSFSGGLLLKVDGFEGGITFKRLRFRIGGSNSAPPFKMDGFFIRLKSATILIDAGGYYTEKEVEDSKVKEFAMTGTVKFSLGPVEYLVGLDFLKGKLTSPTESYDYLMIQAFFRGAIPVGTFEIRGARVLVAWNMQPKLDELDKESQDLRYYNWYKKSNPLTTGGDQRLRAWEANLDSGAFGFGASVSFAGLGTVLEISVFGLGVWGPDENGFLFVGEVFILGSKKPVGFLALEWDGKNDRFAMVIGVDLKVSSFVNGAPSWMDDIAKISGTLFISNDPATVAIGRLNDERTWFGLQLKYDVWVASAFFKFALCFEWVDGVIIGFGIVVRFEGGANFGVLKVKFYLGLGVLVAFFQTGSSDFSVTIWLEGGLRIVLFGFLKFGISARLELRMVGNEPDHGALKATFRFETPWFLPDITWTLEHTWGGTDMDSLSAASAPLRKSAALTASNHTAALFTRFFSPDWNGEETAPVYSVKDLRTISSSEAERLAAFAADTTALPIPTDSTIQLEWAVTVNDLVLQGPPYENKFGKQKSGDIDLVYDFTGIRIRRRPRYDSAAPWTLVEEHFEYVPDFSDPNGVSLVGIISPTEISMVWDPEVKVDNEDAPKRLLINAKTPFLFVTNNPASDEEKIKQNPSWPCCDEERDRTPKLTIHRLWFREDMIGNMVNGPRTFSESLSTWRFSKAPLARPAQFNGLVPANSTIAFISKLEVGIVASADFDNDVGYIMVRMAWQTYSKGKFFKLVALDASNEKEKVIDLPPGSGGQYQTIVVGAPFPIRRLELRMFGDRFPYFDPNNGESYSNYQGRGYGVLELDTVLYMTVEDYLGELRGIGDCSDANREGFDPYQGKGKIDFLPNHEYEISVTTRVSISHPSDQPDPAEITEYTYFRTKGLPGLNAVERVGEEVEPYVAAVYQGGRSLVYREEPVAIAFNEDFHVAIPLAMRPAGAVDEHFTLMQMQLLASPALAEKKGAVFTATDDDWIVSNRSVVLQPFLERWTSKKSDSITKGNNFISLDPALLRLAALTQRPEVDCDLDNPVEVVGTTLIAPPSGSDDPLNPGRELWPGNQGFVASVKQKGAGFVNRQSWVAADKTAFDFASDSLASSAANWSVAGGLLQASSGNNRIFAILGEADWNHLDIQVGVSSSSGYAGVGVSLPAGNVPSRGLFATAKPVAGGYLVEIIERTHGTSFVIAASMNVEMPAGSVAGTPLALKVMAFDDIFRVSVGEQSIEVQRNGFREGRVALVSMGTTNFHSLAIQGLDIFTFPFQVSRYRSFTDHLQSFLGEVDVIDNSLMGAGGAPVNVGALYSSMASEIQSAMLPTASDELRQATFDKWLQETSAPVKTDLTEVELSRYASGNKTAFFVLESTEPLDFTEEITLRMQKRVRKPGGGIWTGPKVYERDWRFREEFEGPIPRFRNQVDGSKLIEAQKAFRDTILFRDGAIDNPNAPLPRPVPQPRPMGAGIRGVELHPDGSSIQVDFEGEMDPNLIFFEKKKAGSGLDTLRFFAGGGGKSKSGKNSAEFGPGVALLDDELAGKLQYAIEGIDKGVLGLIDKGKGGIQFYWPQYEYVEVEVKVLQDGSRTKAILIPVNGVAHELLPASRYRLEFALSRSRWSTTDPVDDLNTYAQSTTLSFNV